MQNDHKKRKTGKNGTQMSGAELKQLRLEMGIGACGMYRILGLPRRTYQDYEAGRRGIPEHVAIAARAAHQRERSFMASLSDRIAAAIDRDYPHGIPSECTGKNE